MLAYARLTSLLTPQGSWFVCLFIAIPVLTTRISSQIRKAFPSLFSLEALSKIQPPLSSFILLLPPCFLLLPEIFKCFLKYSFASLGPSLQFCFTLDSWTLQLRLHMFLWFLSSLRHAFQEVLLTFILYTHLTYRFLCVSWDCQCPFVNAQSWHSPYQQLPLSFFKGTLLHWKAYQLLLPPCSVLGFLYPWSPSNSTLCVFSCSD